MKQFYFNLIDICILNPTAAPVRLVLFVQGCAKQSSIQDINFIKSYIPSYQIKSNNAFYSL